ncbi:MAG: AroB-related putative sugar phosphate phospholyase (cyclizing) [Pseudomonadota bacterium]
MSEFFEINAHTGNYRVVFEKDVMHYLARDVDKIAHLIIDKNVMSLYQKRLQPILLQAASVLCIETAESAKSLEQLPEYVKFLTAHQLRRDHRLIAIGGGVVQDITCFLAATILRGVKWCFYPTTLLAQADSCIGSKSSLNCGDIKNILGTFTPPEKVIIDVLFLDTLKKCDLQSGMGEMLKVHAIDSPQAFDKIAQDYHAIFEDRALMIKYIRRSLEIKKYYIEIDEFDRHERNVMNYGHSFGHAIESATYYKIPHGIAVSMGMDMANYISPQLKLGRKDTYLRMHDILNENYNDFRDIDISTIRFFEALSKDKKNLGQQALALILPDEQGRIGKHICNDSKVVYEICLQYFKHMTLEKINIG